MRRLYLILIIATFIAAALPATAFAKQASHPNSRALRSSMVQAAQGDEFTSTATGFAPNGLVGDLFNLMRGIREPLDDSTSLTIRAGNGVRVKLTF